MSKILIAPGRDEDDFDGWFSYRFRRIVRALKKAAEVEVLDWCSALKKRLEQGGIDILVFTSGSSLVDAIKLRRGYPSLKIVLFTDLRPARIKIPPGVIALDKDKTIKTGKAIRSAVLG